MSQLHEAYENSKEIGDLICEKLIAEIEKTGFSTEEVPGLPIFENAQFSLHKDPYTADENLIGSWFDKDKQKVGNIQFLSDGSFFAEYDVVKPHPTKQQWFVEGVTAWGKPDNIKTEAKLLPVAE